MKKIVYVYFPVSNKNIYERVESISSTKRDSLNIEFSIPRRRDLLSTIDILDEINGELNNRDRDWFEIINDNLICKLNTIKKINNLESLHWLNGKIKVMPEINVTGNRINMTISIDKLLVMKENIKDKIFLSHKSSNKELVRDYSKTLALMGYNPWLDEEEMPAGTVPHRGILDGFKKSCAVIFFITDDFKDERFLANEINYAITEKTERGDDFSIITLVMSNNAQIPELLQTYIWKSPKTLLEGLREIINALPRVLNE